MQPKSFSFHHTGHVFWMLKIIQEKHYIWILQIPILK